MARESAPEGIDFQEKVSVSARRLQENQAQLPRFSSHRPNMPAKRGCNIFRADFLPD
jgi:hypothetical protein